MTETSHWPQTWPRSRRGTSRWLGENILSVLTDWREDSKIGREGGGGGGEEKEGEEEDVAFRAYHECTAWLERTQQDRATCR